MYELIINTGTMNKKVYIAPTMELTKMHVNTTILAGSDGTTIGGGGTSGGGITGGDAKKGGTQFQFRDVWED